MGGGFRAWPFKVPASGAVLQRSGGKDPHVDGRQLRSTSPAHAHLVLSCISIIKYSQTVA